MAHCDVFWASTADSPEARTILDNAELTRYHRFSSPGDKARFVTGRATARRAIAELTGHSPEEIRFGYDCRYCGAQHGKPFVEGSDLNFSISHASGRVVVAVMRAVDVGVDVEEVVAGDHDRTARRILTDAEYANFGCNPPALRARAFFVCWTRKEALLKATGLGLASPMRGVSVTSAAEPAAVVTWRDRPTAAVQLVDIDAGPGYVAALAALTAESLHIRVHSAHDLAIS